MSSSAIFSPDDPAPEAADDAPAPEAAMEDPSRPAMMRGGDDKLPNSRRLDANSHYANSCYEELIHATNRPGLEKKVKSCRTNTLIVSASQTTTWDQQSI